ncbi:ditrans,polycis-polyprenyl diphosphate synthase [(2E,6E)-farnesydiphosphate specific] [Ranunculus cassubicifolius]
MGIFSSSLSNCLNKDNVCTFMRKCLFRVLSVGSIPNHIAFIMDGNRRYARSVNLNEGEGHKVGSVALMSMLRYCYELGVKYVTIYAFSIDNFKRNPQEVESLMNLMQEKIEGLLKEESIVTSYGIRVYFVGNLKLLPEPVRLAAEKAMAATAKNNKAFLSICVAYTSTDEIVHAVRGACGERKKMIQETDSKDLCVKSADIERHLYTSMIPDPDIVVRTSGETRLSNFLLWQTTYSYLYSPSALWPEISFWHLVWGVLNYQRAKPYLEKKKKQL